ncbi:MAG: thymidine kinase [Candidatus Pacebacteria bacterium]|nr:thymidine kinase [Candidatus Paceibacterota bacterium]
MDLTLILGPMKSGKSYELISFFAPLSYTNLKFGLYQSARNVRDSFVISRNGAKLNAKKIASLHEILDDDVEVVGIDEIHMFEEGDIKAIEEMLKKNIKVIISGLDTDYQGKLFNTIAKLMELAPKEIRYRRAVCDVCKSPEAIYTQVFAGDKVITSGMPSVIPDDGTYTYSVACRKCFVKGEN